MIHPAIAWALYATGHANSVVFDKWLPWGMRGPIYRAYSGLMCWSSEVQGDGAGPWLAG